VRAAVQERVDDVRVSVEGEDDVRLGGEQLREAIGRHPVRVLVRARDGEEIDDVDDPHVQLGRVLAQEGGRRHRLQRRHVAGAGENHVGIVRTSGRPFPHRRAAGAVVARRRQIEPLQLRLLVDDDEVHVVAAAQAVIGDREQTVGVGREVDAGDLALLADDGVDESRSLVREPVVVVAPAGGSEEDVERRDRRSPLELAAHLQPLRVLGGHRGDDHGERLVGAEHPVAAGEQVTFQESLAVVLAQDLDHAAVRGEMVVARLQPFGEDAVLHLEHGAEAIGVQLVGAEETEIPLLGGACEDVAQQHAQLPGGFALLGSRRLHRNGIFRVVGQIERHQQLPAICMRICAHASRARRRLRANVRT